MRILDRYLIRGFFWPFAYCMTLFTVLFVIIDVFNHLDELLRSGVSVGVIASYYAYLLPAVLIHIVPISVLMAILYKLGNLSRHNELVALRASGVSPAHILLPYIFAGVLISSAMFVVAESVIPQAALTSTAIKEGLIEKGKKSLHERSINNVTLYAPDKRMIYAREFEVEAKTLHDVVILRDGEDQSLQSKLAAKKARYEDGRWMFSDVIRYQLDPAGNLIGEPEFAERMEIELKATPEDFIREASQVEFMSARQLGDYLAQLKGGSRQMLRRLSVELHYKIAFPLVSLVVMLVGAPLAMRTERSGVFVGIGTALVVVALYYGVNSICLALGKGGHLDPLVAAWFSNALFACVGVYLIGKAA